MPTTGGALRYEAVEGYQSVDEELFKKIQEEGKPAILRNCYFGDCMKRWNLDYLTDELKNDLIVIHESENSRLDFLSKNFKYKTCSFSEFSTLLKNYKSNRHVYLRSTNRNPRAKTPARIESDFPAISKDIQVPKYIPYGSNNDLFHSSVLRIASANVQIWTHFDLYENVLCQIIGTKRVILFDPGDTKYLYVKGDKSLVNDFDNLEQCCEQFPLVLKTRPYQCILNPGDVLYLPALWWHNIKTVSHDEPHCDKDHSIGFNVFWKDPTIHSKSLYAATDVYGNKNLPLFDSALANLDKAICHIEKLPGKYKIFYKYMLFEQLKSKLFSDGHGLD